MDVYLPNIFKYKLNCRVVTFLVTELLKTKNIIIFETRCKCQGKGAFVLRADVLGAGVWGRLFEGRGECPDASLLTNQPLYAATRH